MFILHVGWLLTAPTDKTRGLVVLKKPKRQETPREKNVPLESLMNAFWTADDELDDFRVNVRAADLDAAAVKRLGAPGFWHGKQDFGARMERAYRDVARAALELTRA